MDFSAILAALKQNFTLRNLTINAAYIICIALAFEGISWWASRKLEKLVAPFITIDADRETPWRIRRRTLVRQTPKLLSRSVLYTMAIILIFNVFGVPVLPLSLSVGAVLLLFGSGLLPVLRDIGQGYVLMAEDSIAPGDVVVIQGQPGIVEKFTLRGIQLRDNEGHLHYISNRDVANHSVYRRKVQEQVKEPL